jgi:WD40 repeat protein
VATNLPIRGTWQCAFSPDGRWLASLQKDAMTVWGTDNWSPRYRISHPPEDVRRGLAFSPDGRILATFASDWHVRLLRFETGEVIATFPVGRLVKDLCFSLRGDRLAIAYESGHLQLWALRRVREQLAALQLDWDLPPYPPELPALWGPPLRVIVHTNAPASPTPTVGN